MPNTPHNLEEIAKKAKTSTDCLSKSGIGAEFVKELQLYKCSYGKIDNCPFYRGSVLSFKNGQETYLCGFFDNPKLDRYLHPERHA